MRYPGFIGPSYTLDSKNIDAQRCVNWYLKTNEMGRGKSSEPASLICTPGLRTLATIGDGPIRGQHVASDNKLYVVSGNGFYKVASDYSYKQIGVLETDSGTVDFADNGTTLVIVDGTNGYYHALGGTIITQFEKTDNWLGSTRVEYLDGYFIFNKPETGIFYISNLLSTTLDALDFSTAESSPDNIISTLVNHRELWIFGTDSIEAWYNSGAADFPFERIQGGAMEMGCAAAHSVAKIDKTTLWIGKNKDGQGIVYAAQGFIPQRISTHAIELAIQSYGDISDAIAWTYQENGHRFYVLNFTNANTTWVFDLATGMWHERAYLTGGNFERHRANNHSFAFNTHIVGDYVNGKIYELDSSYSTDFGDEIKRLRSAPHIDDSMKRVQHNAFQLELEPGKKMDGEDLDDSAVMILKFSDDGGHNWSHEKYKNVGLIGNKKTRLIWRRLGVSRDRIYEISYSDKVLLNLIGSELTLTRMNN